MCLCILNDDSMVVHQICIYNTFQPGEYAELIIIIIIINKTDTNWTGHFRKKYNLFTLIWHRPVDFTSFNLYHSLGLFSRRQIDDFFFLFLLENRISYFYLNCPSWLQFAWNANICFSWKNKNILKWRLLKILPIEAVLTSTTIYVLEQK